jgi:hypothetical protein
MTTTEYHPTSLQKGEVSAEGILWTLFVYSNFLSRTILNTDQHILDMTPNYSRGPFQIIRDVKFKGGLVIIHQHSPANKSVSLIEMISCIEVLVAENGVALTCVFTCTYERSTDKETGPVNEYLFRIIATREERIRFLAEIRRQYVMDVGTWMSINMNPSLRIRNEPLAGDPSLPSSNVIPTLAANTVQGLSSQKPLLMLRIKDSPARNPSKRPILFIPLWPPFASAASKINQRSQKYSLSLLELSGDIVYAI